MTRDTILSDLLRSGFGLVIYCALPSCYRKVRWSAQQAVGVLGPDLTFPQAARRLRCSGCGSLGRHGFITCRTDLNDTDEAHLRWLIQSETERYGAPMFDADLALERIRQRRLHDFGDN